MTRRAPSSLLSIRMFVAAYETGSFTAAAARLYATQSGISQHIRQLETGLGVNLFGRSKGGGIEPTPAGHSYYHQCVELLRMHDKAALSIQTFAQGLEGYISVGISPTIAQAAIASSLTAFVEKHPSIRVHITEDYSARLSERVASQDLDFAIIFRGGDEIGIHSQSFLRTPELLVSGPRSGRPRFLPMRLADVGPLKLVVPGINSRRAAIEAYCATYGAEIVRLLELDSLACVLEFVAVNDWSVILPAPAIMNERSLSRLTINQIVDPPLEAELVLIHPSSEVLSRAAQEFRLELERSVSDVNDRWAKLVATAVGSRGPS